MHDVVDRTSSEFKNYLELYEHAPLLELGQLADAERWRQHPGERGHLHHRPEHQLHQRLRRRLQVLRVLPPAQARRRATSLSFEQIGAKIDECKAIGGVQILLQGGHNPYIPFEWYLDLMRYIKRIIRSTSTASRPSEVVFFSERFGLPVRRRRPRAAGGRARQHPRRRRRDPGGRVRERVAKKKAQTEEWLGVQEVAHRQGMKTSVTMMYGLGETLADRIEHLLRVRELQARTGGFTAFICWPLQPEGTPEMSHIPEDRRRRPTCAPSRIARIVLDNVPNLQSSLGHDGPQGRADRPPLRRQRLRQPDDGGERRLGGGHHLPHHARARSSG